MNPTSTSAPKTDPASATPSHRRSGSAGTHRLVGQLWGWLARHPMVVVMVLVIFYFSYMSKRFNSLDNVQTIGLAAAPFALIALGQTLVILTGGIDLSVGSIIAASAMTAAIVVRGHPDRVLLAVLAAALVGALVGAINGTLVAAFNVPPFVATLGLMTVASGAAYVIGGGAAINGLPPEFGAIANQTVLGIELPVLIMIVGFAVFLVMMAKSAYGMRIYAVGGNPVAAQIAGIKVPRVLFSVYLISGALAGLSGVILSSRVISAFPTLGDGYELDAIAAVVIGGASLLGGRGNVAGTILGLFLIQTLNNGLDLLIVPAYWQQVIKGVLIVLAVAIDVWAMRRRRTST